MNHPPPPADLNTRKPRLRVLPAGTSLHRFHDGAFAPIHFATGDGGRLNAPDGSFGVLYAALSPSGAFAETFLRTPGATLIPGDLIARKAYAVLSATRPLRLIALHGPSAAAIGCTAELTHAAPPYALAQQWSLALHAHPLAADGLAYRSRHNDDEICIALFSRAHAAITIDRQVANVGAPWFYDLANRHGVGVLP